MVDTVHNTSRRALILLRVLHVIDDMTFDWGIMDTAAFADVIVTVVAAAYS